MPFCIRNTIRLNMSGYNIYKDRISFMNHNRSLPPVTIETLNRDRSFDKRQYLNKELKDMFFSLNLIESYSGIRRAKDALLENGSPELKFYPDMKKITIPMQLWV